ncbi:MAG: hypothetical protein ABJB10_03150, partial [Mesorhizobium sp.]
LAEQLPHHATDLAARRLAAPQLLKTLGLVPSTSEAARLIAQGGVSIIRGDQTSFWKYPGYGDEIRMAWDDERLRRCSAGSGLVGRHLLRWKVIASMLPTIRRQVHR